MAAVHGCGSVLILTRQVELDRGSHSGSHDSPLRVALYSAPIDRPHADWKVETEGFVSCTTTWGETDFPAEGRGSGQGTGTALQRGRNGVLIPLRG